MMAIIRHRADTPSPRPPAPPLTIAFQISVYYGAKDFNTVFHGGSLSCHFFESISRSAVDLFSEFVESIHPSVRPSVHPFKISAQRDTIRI